MTVVLIKRGNLDTETVTHRGKKNAKTHMKMED